MTDISDGESLDITSASKDNISFGMDVVNKKEEASHREATIIYTDALPTRPKRPVH